MVIINKVKRNYKIYMFVFNSVTSGVGNLDKSNAMISLDPINNFKIEHIIKRVYDKNIQ